MKEKSRPRNGVSDLLNYIYFSVLYKKRMINQFEVYSFEFGSDKRLDLKDFKGSSGLNMYVKCGSLTYGYVKDLACIGSYLIIKHFAVENQSLTKKGVGKAMAHGLAGVARRIGVEAIYFTENSQGKGHQKFFESIGAHPMALSQLQKSKDWIWIVDTIKYVSRNVDALVDGQEYAIEDYSFIVDKTLEALSLSINDAGSIDNSIDRLESELSGLQSINSPTIEEQRHRIEGAITLLKRLRVKVSKKIR